MPLHRFVAFAWHLATRNGEPKDVQAFRERVWMPPKGVVADPRSPWSAANETRMFQAAKAQMGLR